MDKILNFNFKNKITLINNLLFTAINYNRNMVNYNSY